jgi:serine/threonine-protein kinase
VPLLPLPNPARTRIPANPTNPTNPTTAPTNTTPSATTPAAQTPNPILLDTDAASTYNPSGYPASYFGDPSLAIDGDTTTSWTAQVEPKVAPLMASGLALDFKAPTRLGSLEIVTTTPGMTVEVFGANGSALPAAITDPAWRKLSPSHLVKKKTATIKLAGGGKAFRFMVLWLTKAPTASVGTPTAPGHVSIGEVVPYPPTR